MHAPHHFGHAWYPPAGYDYAPYVDAEFVGGPPKVVTYVPESSFPTALVIGVAVAGAVAAYFIYTAGKAGPVQRKMTRAAMQILGDEARKQGKAVARHAGRAAAGYAQRVFDRRS